MGAWERGATLAAGVALAACGARGDLPDVVARDAGATTAVATSPSPAEQRPAGTACAFDRQCASGRCSADPRSAACGVCLVVRALGERCDGARDTCRRSAQCAGGVCVTLKGAIGDACAIGSLGEDRGDCDDDLACVAPPLARAGVCALRLAANAPCTPPLGVRISTASPPCGVGFFCDVQSARCTARVPAHDGEPCDAFGRGQPCATGLLCDLHRGVCHPPTLPLGARCASGDGSGNECAGGNVCGNLAHPQGGGGDVAFTCLAPPPEGEPCIWQTCARGLYCANGEAQCTGCALARCERAHAEGASCSNDVAGTVACLEGLECRAGTCRKECR